MYYGFLCRFFFLYSLLLFCNQEKLGNKPYHTSTLWYADIFAKIFGTFCKIWQFNNVQQIADTNKMKEKTKWRSGFVSIQVSCERARTGQRSGYKPVYTRSTTSSRYNIPFFPAIRSIYTRIYHFYGGNSLAWNKRLITLTYAHASDFW